MPKLKKESVEDYMWVEMSGSVDPLETKHYRLITQEQYEAELKEAYFSGWEDRNDNELTEIFHKRSRTKEEYFKWFMEEKKRANTKRRQR